MFDANTHVGILQPQGRFGRGPIVGLVAVSIVNLVIVAGTSLMFVAYDAGFIWGSAVSVGANIVMTAIVLGLMRSTGSQSFGYDRFGACNTVTHFRGSLACVLLIPLANPPSLDNPAVAWTVFTIALVALCLDGIDGWLARRGRMVSAFGARFDLEVDSFLALVLALLALANGDAGPVVLVLGLARYLFWGATFVLPWLAAPLPDRYARKVVCVIQLGVLIALQVPPLPDAIGTIATLVAASLLVWSFAHDIRWLAAQVGQPCA